MTDKQDQELSELADAIAGGEYTILDEPADLPPAATEDPIVVRSLRCPSTSSNAQGRQPPGVV